MNKKKETKVYPKDPVTIIFFLILISHIDFNHLCVQIAEHYI